MMPFPLSLAVLALSGLSRVFAFDDITIPSTVQAGTDVKVAIDNDISSASSSSTRGGDGDSFDAGFTNFRVYLSVSAPGTGYGPCCWLINSTSINTTSVTVNIPASVGPSGPDVSPYAIVTAEFNDGANADSGPSGFEYSNDFSLEGGTGVFTEYEKHQMSVGDPDHLPCTAYDCARQCSQKYYPGNSQDQLTDTMDGYKSTYECQAACPGVNYPSWDSLMADGRGSDDNSTASSSSSATKSATTTTSATGKGAGASTSASKTSGASTASKTPTSAASCAIVERSAWLAASVFGLVAFVWL